ncbi:hypothetical protein D5018_16150 [Parashewanella curva]|uniref:Uncharacterized protein n=1 Tax=Parashewanella curva TaxID=2338552 RepID=A0A3L8PVP8_9GAMM|nr:hypothetical protein [Parashewanella curva]RLV58653.1 hypothetical protein D5018_16150 [Parashewanella curva]
MKSVIFALGLLGSFFYSTNLNASETPLFNDRPIVCMDISQVSNQHSPNVLFHSLRDCLKKRDFWKAAKLNFAANLYGNYDALRVDGEPENIAFNKLRLKAVKDIPIHDYSTFQQTSEALLRDKKKKNDLCKLMTVIGKPDYHPNYIFKHAEQYTKLVPSINSDKQDSRFWKKVLLNDGHCMQ